MKKITTILFFLNCFYNSNSQKLDSIACKRVEDTLNIIKNYIENDRVFSSPYRISAVEFMIELSGIPYEGGVSFFGAEFPSKNFYFKCKEWYSINRRFLRWDNDKNKIYLKKD